MLVFLFVVCVGVCVLVFVCEGVCVLVGVCVLCLCVFVFLFE